MEVAPAGAAISRLQETRAVPHRVARGGSWTADPEKIRARSGGLSGPGRATIAGPKYRSSVTDNKAHSRREAADARKEMAAVDVPLNPVVTISGGHDEAEEVHAHAS